MAGRPSEMRIRGGAKVSLLLYFPDFCEMACGYMARVKGKLGGHTRDVCTRGIFVHGVNSEESSCES